MWPNATSVSLLEDVKGRMRHEHRKIIITRSVRLKVSLNLNKCSIVCTILCLTPYLDFYQKQWSLYLAAIIHNLQRLEPGTT